MSTEAIAPKDMQGTEIPPEAVQAGEKTPATEPLLPKGLSALVVKTVANASTEPTTEQLIADGELSDSATHTATPTEYAQPVSTVAGVFSVDLEKAMSEGADKLSKSEIAVASTFSAIKAMAKVFAETMRQKAIPPLYDETPIEPKAPNAMQRALHITPTSPGIVRTPYWIVLSDRDLSLRDMKPRATNSLGHVKKYDLVGYGYSERAIGVTADGELVRLSREYAEAVITPPDFEIDKTKPVEPNDLFDDTKVNYFWPLGDPATILSKFENSLAERAVKNLRLKGTATYGYDTETVLYKQSRKRAQIAT